MLLSHYMPTMLSGMLLLSNRLREHTCSIILFTRQCTLTECVLLLTNAQVQQCNIDFCAYRRVSHAPWRTEATTLAAKQHSQSSDTSKQEFVASAFRRALFGAFTFAFATAGAVGRAVPEFARRVAFVDSCNRIIIIK